MNTQQAETLDHNPQYIGIPKRFVASFIDSLALSLIFFICFLGKTQSESPVKLAAYLLLSIPISWAYFALLESSPAQATLGKMALDIMVINHHGKKLSLQQATIRYFSKSLWVIVFFGGAIVSVAALATGNNESPYLVLAGLLILISLPIGIFSYLMPAFNPERQALHDRIARTFVIDAETQPKHLPQKALLQIIAVALISGLLFHLVPDSGETIPPIPPSPPPIEPTPSPSPDPSPVEPLPPEPTPEPPTEGSSNPLILNVDLCGLKEQTYPPNPNSYLDGNWKIQFSVGPVLHTSLLKMEGDSGIMKTQVFDSKTEKTQTVLQDIRLRQSPTGLWLLGYTPIDATTKQPANYTPDNIYLQQRPDGSIITINCDDKGNFSPISMEQIRE